MERHRGMEEKIRYFQDILGRLKTLLGDYISDMEGHIMPKDENVIMLVDRNDIWWNMKQIEANINIAGSLAAGRELRYYRDADTTPSPPHIYRGGAEAAVVDFISGILGLAVMLAKIDLALRVAVVTIPFGTTSQWVKDTGQETWEGALGITQILKNPGRALAAIGQKATDAVEEKGIPYALSYAVTDITIGMLVNKGLGKLKALARGDDVADAAKILDNLDEAADIADDFGNITKAVEKIDDAAGMADDVAALGNIEGGLGAKNRQGQPVPITEKL